jgi:hypothetical protein
MMGYAQKAVSWQDLSDVTFEQKLHKEFKVDYLHPIFGKSVKDLEGKTIVVTGYFLNLDSKTKKFLLSKNPMAACFFCGNGGPETIMEIKFKGDEEFKTDDLVTITGNLKLNEDNIDYANYILEDASGMIIE